jgi:signal transduction histidine kinase
MIHAYPEGRGGSIDIEVRPADRNHIEIVIADDGCGMAPEVKRQAFDPFFTTRRHEGATGLGLHTVHSILVDRLGGRIRLDSEPDVGTVVRLVMPRSAVTGD